MPGRSRRAPAARQGAVGRAGAHDGRGGAEPAAAGEPGALEEREPADPGAGGGAGRLGRGLLRRAGLGAADHDGVRRRQADAGRAGEATGVRVVERRVGRGGGHCEGACGHRSGDLGAGAVHLSAAEPGEARGVRGHREGGLPRAGRGGVGAEEDVEPPRRGHREGPDGRVLRDGVVGHHHEGERGRDRDGRATADEGGDAETGGAEPGRDGEGCVGADPARGDRALGPLLGVDVAVAPVVEGHAGPVEAGGGDRHRPAAARRSPRARRRTTRLRGWRTRRVPGSARRGRRPSRRHPVGAVRRPGEQGVPLLRESVLLRADRLLEEEAEGGQGAGLADGHRPRGEAREVEDQRRCEGRVAALPGELHRHPGAEEAVEADVVPGGLPVAEVLDVVDVHRAGHRVAEHRLQAGALGARLALPAAGSDRVDPSPPPSRLIEVHDRTASDRVENIGASADFTRVSPVLPSLPA